MTVTDKISINTRSSQQLIDEFAQPADHHYSLKFNKQQRRRQSLVGRALVRRLLVQTSTTNPAEWDLTPDVGQPWQAKCFHTPPCSGSHKYKRSPIFFSISHSQQWVVAAIDETHPVGIDIEQVSPTRDMNKLLTGIIDTQSPELPASIEGQYLLWCAFEAYCKVRYQRLVFPVPPALLLLNWNQLELNDSCLQIEESNFIFKADRFEEFVCVLCYQQLA